MNGVVNSEKYAAYLFKGHGEKNGIAKQNACPLPLGAALQTETALLCGAVALNPLTQSIFLNPRYLFSIWQRPLADLR